MPKVKIYPLDEVIIYTEDGTKIGKTFTVDTRWEGMVMYRSTIDNQTIIVNMQDQRTGLEKFFNDPPKDTLVEVVKASPDLAAAICKGGEL